MGCIAVVFPDALSPTKRAPFNNLPFVFCSILFLKKMYFSTKFEGNSILRKWFDFLKKSVWINAYTRSIVSFNGENLTFSKYFDKNGTDEVNEFLKNNRFKYSIQYTRQIGKNDVNYFLSEEEGKMVFFEREEISVPIPLIWESTGNKTLINILPVLSLALIFLLRLSRALAKKLGEEIGYFLLVIIRAAEIKIIKSTGVKVSIRTPD